MNKKISTPIAIIIIVLCAFLVGGLVAWQYLETPKEEEISKTKPSEKEFTEVPLEELKEGENKIGAIKIEKVVFSQLKPITEENDEMKYKIDGVKVDFSWKDNQYAIYSGDKMINKGGGYSDIDSFKVATLNYGEREYILIWINLCAAGNCWDIYNFYFKTKGGELKLVKDTSGKLFELFETNGHIMIGYNGFLYLISYIYSPRNGYISLDIYILDEDKVKYGKHSEGFADNPTKLNVTSVIEKNNKLYIKISNIDKGVEEYYLLDGLNLVESNSEFDNE